MADLRRLRRHYRPIAAFHRFFKLLRCGPSLRPFVHSAAFFWLKRRSADKPESCRQGHCSRGNPSHLSQDLRCVALGVAKPAIGLRQETTGPSCTSTAYQSIKTRGFSRERVFCSTSMRTAIASPTLRPLTRALSQMRLHDFGDHGSEAPASQLRSAVATHRMSSSGLVRGVVS
jgi:hypothetical protein